MTDEERCELAPSGERTRTGIRALVLDLAKEGRKKAEIYATLESVLVRLRAVAAGRNRKRAS